MTQPICLRLILGFTLGFVVAFAGCAGATDGAASGDSLGASQCASAPPWTPGTSYATGDLVGFQGQIYRCVQGHTALDVWPPDIVPALWAPTACAPVPPPSNPPPSNPPPSNPPPSNPPPSNPPPGTPSGVEYAPYFYSWGWGNPAYPFNGLADLKSKSGLDAVTIAFVLSSGGCTASRDIQDHASDVAAFVGAGGHVKASFGGANGTYLENACPDAASLAKAIGDFVDSTGITDLDFDVEQPGAMTASVNQLRSTALASLQKSKSVRVAFTLPSLPRDKWNTPGGLDANGKAVVQAAVAAGVQLSHVNLMTMDFGGYYSNGNKMSDLAASAATDCAAQLQSIIAGLTPAQAFAMVGITPMIGVNDVASEVFSLADASALVAFARAKGVGLLAFWAINRDQPCASQSLALCSEAQTSSFQYHQIFNGVK